MTNFLRAPSAGDYGGGAATTGLSESVFQPGRPPQSSATAAAASFDSASSGVNVILTHPLNHSKDNAGGKMLSQVLADVQTVHTYCSTRPRPRAKIENALLRVYCALQDLLESTRALLDAGDSEILRTISAD